MKLILTLGLAAICLLFLALWASLGDSQFEGEGASAQASLATEAGPDEVPVSVASLKSTGTGDVGARSVIPEAVAPQGGYNPLRAMLSALDPRTLSPSSGAGLLLTSATGQQLEIPAGFTQAFQLDPGEWSIESKQPGWGIAPRQISLGVGEQGTVWVTRPGSVRLRVLSSVGLPLEGARVGWWQSTEKTHTRFGGLRPTSWADSDATGRVTLELTGSGTGIIRVWEPAHLPAERLLIAETTDEITIILSPTEESAKPLLFVMEETGQPVPNISVRDRYGRQVANGDNLGRVLVPGWVGPDDFLVLDATGRASAHLRLTNLDLDKEQIPWAREVELVASAEDGREFVAFATIEAAQAGPLTYHPKGEERREPTRTFRRSLPAGANVLLQCTDTQGRTVSARVDTSTGDRELTLEFTQPMCLEVIVRDPGGAEVPNIKALVTFDGSNVPMPVSPGPDGKLRVPLEPDVDGFRIDARGFASCEIAPRSKDPEALQGTLEITLRPTANMELHLTDLDGSPNVGIEISVDDRLSWDAFKLYPELNGSLPSGHPGWSIDTPRTRRAVADATGRVQLRNVALGSYAVNASVLNTLDFGGSSSFAPTETVFQHRSPAPVRLAFPKPLLVEIEAISMPAGTPVERILVQSFTNPGLTFREQPGSRWQGWIELDMGELVISAPGHTSATIQSQDLALSGRLRVELRSDHASVLALSGDWNSLPGASFTVSARRSQKPENPEAWSGSFEVWSAELRVEGGFSELNFPFEGDFEFQPVVGEQHVWLFEPSKIYWTLGIHPKLHVQRVDRDLWEGMEH